jgi:hypothetical protein
MFCCKTPGWAKKRAIIECALVVVFCSPGCAFLWMCVRPDVRSLVRPSACAFPSPPPNACSVLGWLTERLFYAWFVLGSCPGSCIPWKKS